MALNDIYEVQYFITSDDKETCTSMHLRESVARVGTPLQVANQLTGVLDNLFWTIFWQPFCSPDASYIKTRAQMIFPTREAFFDNVTSAGQAGAAIGNQMNGTTAVLFALYGEAWGANWRGRMYVPGLPDVDANQGRLLTADHASIQAAFQINFIGTIVLPAPADVTLTYCVFSQTRAHPAGDPPPPPVLPVHSDIATNILRPRIATQRRRRTTVAATI